MFEMEKFANGTKAILEKVCEATKNGVATVIGKIRTALAKVSNFLYYHTHFGNSLYFIWKWFLMKRSKVALKILVKFTTEKKKDR